MDIEVRSSRMLFGVKPEDIRKANELLDEVLNTLEARVDQNQNR